MDDFEKSRLRALEELEISSNPDDDDLNKITEKASKLAGTKIALISLVEESRQWFKSKVGLEANETPRDISFCTHAIKTPNPMIIHNAKEDKLFCDNPLVKGELDITFYAGFPLTTADGYPIGTLCVIDSEEKSLDNETIEKLYLLSRQAIKILEEKRLKRQQQQAKEE